MRHGGGEGAGRQRSQGKFKLLRCCFEGSRYGRWGAIQRLFLWDKLGRGELGEKSFR